VSRPGAGPTCLFERKTDDHRLVVKCRDEIALVLAPPGLLAADLKPGDLLRWIPDALVAIERVDHAQDSAFFLEAAPDVTFDNIGGLDDAIGRILDILDIHWFHPEAARRFRLPRKGSLLLVGPAGNGKTMIGKALANLLGQRTCGGRAHFLNIKPGALHSVWYSQSEANYREVFRVARELGEKDPATPVVMFLDEVDAIGVARGHSHMRVHDTVLTALIAELDGLAERGNILVVAATNRREALDPALLRPGRLGDIILEVPRPGLRGARQIFAKHLPEDIPYAVNGQGADSKAQREELIDRAVSRLFAPNAGHELATLTFRDNRRRPVRPADLVSGAVIANISLAAREQASLRCRNAGDVGLRLEDLLDAIEREFDAAAGVLTPANCRNFLTDLPYDADIVNVERPLRRPAATHRFINLE
jgi:proteasome-associated ATPase